MLIFMQSFGRWISTNFTMDRSNQFNITSTDIINESIWWSRWKDNSNDMKWHPEGQWITWQSILNNNLGNFNNAYELWPKRVIISVFNQNVQINIFDSTNDFLSIRITPHVSETINSIYAHLITMAWFTEPYMRCSASVNNIFVYFTGVLMKTL